MCERAEGAQNSELKTNSFCMRATSQGVPVAERFSESNVLGEHNSPVGLVNCIGNLHIK